MTSSSTLRGASAVVTGAASGIGDALARALLRGGVRKLFLLDLDTDRLAQLRPPTSDASYTILRADVRDPAALKACFERIALETPQLDFVFNNVGIPAGTPAWPETSLERIRAIIETNLLGVIYGTRLALPLMKQAGGSILNTASTSGLRPYLSGAVYAASKAGVIMFTQSCRALHQEMGVRVNAICPGMVDTPFLAKTGATGEMAGFVQERLKAGAALTADEVALAALELACDPEAAGSYRVIEREPG